MSDQLIITLGREFGSGGHAIAVELANRYGIKLYDHNLLDAVAAEKNVDVETLRRYDEKPRRLLFSRSQNGFSSSAEENVAFLQFEYLKKKADEGESFIVVGRCAETVLGDRPNVISLFVLGDSEVKCKRVMEIYDLSERDAQFKWIVTTSTESSITTTTARISGAIQEPMTYALTAADWDLMRQ